MRELNKYVQEVLKIKIKVLEDHFNGDCIFYYGRPLPSLLTASLAYIAHTPSLSNR